MNLLLILLASLVVILVVIIVALTRSCTSMYNRVQTLEKKNTELLCSLRVYQSNLQVARKNASDDEQITKLRFQLYRKQEQINELQTALKKQRTLLEQKWTEGKQCQK